jgi:hypothetical protein
MSVLTAEDIGEQPHLRLQHHQRLARQRSGRTRPRLLQPVLGLGERIAVQDLHPVSGQQRHAFSAQVPHDLRHLGRRLSHQRPVDPLLHPLELVVQSTKRDRDLLLSPLRFVRRIHRAAHPTDDLAHQIHHRREEQIPLVLHLRLAGEDPIDLLGAKHALHQRAGHHRHRAFLQEPRKDFSEHHRTTLLQEHSASNDLTGV